MWCIFVDGDIADFYDLCSYLWIFVCGLSQFLIPTFSFFMSVTTSELCFYYIQMSTFCLKMLDQKVSYFGCVE